MSGPIIHPLAPLFDENSRILILGTMPSPKSRENGFYYAHPQNRFWRVLASICHEPTPSGNQERMEFCHRHHIALWDVLHACRIDGAEDNSIRDPQPNDLRPILSQAPIQQIFTTGTKASALYKRYCLPATGRPSVPLPSTSPANCRFYTLETLIAAYRILVPYLESHDEQQPCTAG